MNMADVAVGRNFRRLREKAGYSESVLAERIGLSQAALREAERGGRRLTAHELFLISAALKASTHDLLAFNNELDLKTPALPASFKAALEAG